MFFPLHSLSPYCLGYFVKNIHGHQWKQMESNFNLKFNIYKLKAPAAYHMD